MTRTSAPRNEPTPVPWLKVDSLDELMKHEKEIVSYIERVPNGGQLFLIHPFMLFKDIGVELSKRAEEEILTLEPRLSALSTVPYAALKNNKEKQKVQFRVHGLFDRSKKS